MAASTTPARASRRGAAKAAATKAAQTTESLTSPEGTRRDIGRELGGVALIGASLMLLLALVSFRPSSLLEAGASWMGQVGFHVADILYFCVGVLAFLLPILGFVAARHLLFPQDTTRRGAAPIGWTLLTFGGAMGLGAALPDTLWLGYAPAGWVGTLLGTLATTLVGAVGGVLISLVCIVSASILLWEVRASTMWARTGTALTRLHTRLAHWWRTTREARAAAREAAAVAREASRAAADESTAPEASHQPSTREGVTEDVNARGTLTPRHAFQDPVWAQGANDIEPDMSLTFEEPTVGPLGAPTDDPSIAASANAAGDPRVDTTPPAPNAAAGSEVVRTPSAAASAPPGPTAAAAHETVSESTATPAAAAPPAAPQTSPSEGFRDRIRRVLAMGGPSAAPPAAPTAAPPSAPAVAPAPSATARLLDAPSAVSPPLAAGVDGDDDEYTRVDTHAIVSINDADWDDTLVDVEDVVWGSDEAESSQTLVRMPRLAVPAARAVSAGPPALHDEAGDDFDDEDEDDDWSDESPTTLPGAALRLAPPVAPRSSGEVAGPIIVESEALRRRKSEADLERAVPARTASGPSPWVFPPLSFLSYDPHRVSTVDPAFLRAQASQLEEVLASFKILGRVSNICPGPVITRYEFEPVAGTKLSKISGLTDDVAMALRALKVRILAPIPGKGCVGIEVPNTTSETVYLKEIIGDAVFTRAQSKLTVALGKDIEGNPIVADLAKMPHLMVAGTTGSGKSVSVNAMITSILYNASPDDVRMIMIDPKQLEFAIYEDIPHLLLPVVTDPAKAAAALQWAVNEMERRYKLMAAMKVRNLTGYNEKLAALKAEFELAKTTQMPLYDERFELLDKQEANGKPAHRHMYYCVVIVDEFADLMMVAGKDVEAAVARLAQKARAAGIHVILATQRPSVDVITGVIKSNFPTRISFRLMSGIDSRTVLDTIGAENLLGQGDMLFRPPGASELTRVHGAFVDEREIERVVEYLKAQRAPDYDTSILDDIEVTDDDDDEPIDDLYDQACNVVLEAGFASISHVQRKLRVGYNRAARMVERMERDGLVGPASGGSGRREVLVGRI